MVDLFPDPRRDRGGDGALSCRSTASSPVRAPPTVLWLFDVLTIIFGDRHPPNRRSFTGREIYLDVALVYALLSFLGVIVAARYLEGGEQ